MKGSQIHRSKGFAAITVLVISLLGGLIVFDTVQENINQERMAGNYAKELNAHLQAENGLAASYNALSASSSISTEEMMTQLNGTQTTSGGYRHIIDAWLESDSREVSSSGFHYEGQYEMRGSISISSSTGISAFTSAITTCDGVTLSGGGTIDSYDGEYDSSAVGIEGDVTILNEDASGLNLTGGTEISGDVSINGDLSISNGYVYGDAQVSGNVTVANSGAASVDGSIQATGDVSYSYTGNTYTTDSISSNGSVDIGYSSFTGDIDYGGDDGGTLTSSRDISTFASTTENTSDHVNDVGTEECDILAIGDEFDNITDGIGSLASSEATDVTFGWPTTEFIISDSGLIAYDQTWNVNDWVDVDTQTETVDFLDEDTDVYVLDISSFGDASLTLTVESGSDVTIYLSGGENASTTLSGSILVEDGATLTIITESTIDMGSNGTITNVVDTDGDGDYETTTTSAVNSNNEIATTIYSGYDSDGDNNDYGMSIAGGNDSSFSVYAPDASINVTGSGDLYGALRSDYLNVSGGAGIHFDESISDASVGNNDSGDSTPTILRWF